MRRVTLLALLLLLAAQPVLGAPPHVDPVPPVCAGAGQPRAVLVYAHASDRPSRHEPIAPLLRELVEKVNGALDREAGPFPVSYVVECGADGRTRVHALQVPTRRDETTFATLKRDLAAAGHADSDAKYWVWFDGPATLQGELGSADHVHDVRDAPENAANGGPHYAVIWGATPHSLDWRVLMHESAHLMGAVLVDAWESTGDGHTDAPMDVLVAVLENPSVNPTHCYSSWRCRVRMECRDRWAFDCGRDTYFNPDPAQTRIPHWQVGSRNNRFLDFTDQPPFNLALACPPQTQAGAATPCHASAFDREGDVRLRVEWGDGGSDASDPVPSGRVVTLTHAWGAPGEYVVRLTATDAEARSSSLTTAVRVLDCAVNEGGRIRVGLPLVDVEGVTASEWRFVSSACGGKGYALSPEGVEVQWRDASGGRVEGCGRLVPAGAAELRVVARSGTNVPWTLQAPVDAAPCA